MATETSYTAPTEAYRNQNLYRRIRERQYQYERRRELYDEQREVIVELTRPDLVTGDVGSKEEGVFGSSLIVEGSAPEAITVWERGFIGNMISRRSEWFKDKLREPPKWTGVQFQGNDEVNEYLQDFTDHMFSVYARSNYYDTMPEYVRNAGTVGSPLKLFRREITPYEDRVVCMVPDYEAVWIDKDIFGRDNCAHVKWEWTALQASQFFREEDLPQRVRWQLQNGQHYQTSEYIQCIYGAADPIYDGLDVDQTRPWMEHFICLRSDPNEERVIRPKFGGPGYWARPFSTWHYHRNWHEVYSKTMAWYAIYDIRGSNAIWEALFNEADRSTEPPTWALASLRGILDLAVGGENWARTAEEYGQPPQYLMPPTRYDVAIDFSDRLQKAVRRWFHYDLFMMINAAIFNKNQPQTAYALMRAEAERTGQLAPEVETFENQVLAHAHDVMVEMEIRAEPAYPWGRLPKPPDIVLEYSDGEVDVEFIGQLSMAQVRDREVLKFYRNIGAAEAVFQNAEQARHKIKWSQALEEVLEAGDFAQHLIRDEDEYQAILQGIEQRAMQQELAEQAPKLAQAQAQLGKAPEQGSPAAGLLTA